MKFHIYGTKGLVDLPEGTTVEDLRSLAHFNKIIKNYTKMEKIANERPMESPSGTSGIPNTHYEDLEKAAEEYATSLSKGAMDGKEYCKQDFKAGAQWQKEQDEKAWMEDRNGCFWDGVEEGKKVMREQIMKDAVEGEVHHFETVHYIITDEEQLATRLKDFEQDAKVKLIIVKEDEN